MTLRQGRSCRGEGRDLPGRSDRPKELWGVIDIRIVIVPVRSSLRGGHLLTRIVEAKEASPEELAIRACNSGVLAAPADLLFTLLGQVRPDNAKLRRRAAHIVASIAGIDEDAASASLAGAQGDVKCAIVMAGGAATRQIAQDMLARSGGHIDAALARLRARATGS